MTNKSTIPKNEEAAEVAAASKDDAFIDDSQIAEVVEDNGDEPMDEDDEDDGVDLDIDEGEYDGGELTLGHDLTVDEEGNIVLDMANTSVAHFDKHGKSIFLVDSHPTLPLILSGGEDEKAYMWTTNSQPPKLVAELGGQTESVHVGGFSPDGTHVVTADMDGQVRVWRSVSRGQKWEFVGSINEVDEVTWLVFHPTQPFFAFGSQEGAIWVISFDDINTPVSILVGHSTPTNAGVFVDTDNMDTLTLVTLGDESIISWNVYQGTPNYTLKDGDLSNAEGGWITCAVSASGKTIACGNADGHVAIINIENGSIFKIFDNTQSDSTEMEERSVEAVAWAPKTPILVTGNVKGDIILYDITKWTIRRIIPAKDAITSLKFVAGTNTLISSDMAGGIAKWDVLTGQELWRGHGHYDGILGFTIQNEGKRIITAGDQGVSMIFEDN